MKIIVAKDAGYCFGVRDAVNMAYDATEKFGSVYMLGDIVHNERVVKDLANAGAKVVETLDDVPNDSPVLFRAHGTINELWEESKQKNMNVIDATCPLVHEIHREIKKLSENKRKIIVIGDHGHDEVVAIANQVDNAVIISTPEEAKKMKICIAEEQTKGIDETFFFLDVFFFLRQNENDRSRGDKHFGGSFKSK